MVQDVIVKVTAHKNSLYFQVDGAEDGRLRLGNC